MAAASRIDYCGRSSPAVGSRAFRKTQFIIFISRARWCSRRAGCRTSSVATRSCLLEPAYSGFDALFELHNPPARMFPQLLLSSIRTTYCCAIRVGTHSTCISIMHVGRGRGPGSPSTPLHIMHPSSWNDLCSIIHRKRQITQLPHVLTFEYSPPRAEVWVSELFPSLCSVEPCRLHEHGAEPVEIRLRID